MLAMFQETLQAEIASLWSSHQAKITALRSEIQALSIRQVEGSRGSTPNVNIPQPNPTSSSKSIVLNLATQATSPKLSVAGLDGQPDTFVP